MSAFTITITADGRITGLQEAFSKMSLADLIARVVNWPSLHLKMIIAVMAAEVEALCGKRYSRKGASQRPCYRHGTNPGTVRISGRRVPIRVPRVRDVKVKCERVLRSYRAFHEARINEDALMRTLFFGVSQRNYEAIADEYTDAFGLSQSSVGRIFRRSAAKVLKEFYERPLNDYDLVGLFIDGKYFRKHQVLIAMGLTSEGKKVVLGCVEVGSESQEATKGLLEDLFDRGLQIHQGLLCVVDGAKGLHAAIKEVFGGFVQVQRCCWHKRENVVAHMSKEDKLVYRARLQKAYQIPDYRDAKAELLSIKDDLEASNQLKAMKSLEEGMEETLTIQRLGIAKELGQSLRTTNCIENLNSTLGRLTRNVCSWKNSAQVHRWMTLALMYAEPKLKTIPNHQHLLKLREALIKAKTRLPNPKIPFSPQPRFH